MVWRILPKPMVIIYEIIQQVTHCNINHCSVVFFPVFPVSPFNSTCNYKNCCYYMKIYRNIKDNIHLLLNNITNILTSLLQSYPICHRRKYVILSLLITHLQTHCAQSATGKIKIFCLNTEKCGDKTLLPVYSIITMLVNRENCAEISGLYKKNVFILA